MFDVPNARGMPSRNVRGQKLYNAYLSRDTNNSSEALRTLPRQDFDYWCGARSFF
jgi:hypothetical protein